jgi:hypothetical protein
VVPQAVTDTDTEAVLDGVGAGDALAPPLPLPRGDTLALPEPLPQPVGAALADAEGVSVELPTVADGVALADAVPDTAAEGVTVDVIVAHELALPVAESGSDGDADAVAVAVDALKPVALAPAEAVAPVEPLDDDDAECVVHAVAEVDDDALVSLKEAVGDPEAVAATDADAVAEVDTAVPVDEGEGVKEPVGLALSDPLPAGASVLGSGLGGDSAMLAGDAGTAGPSAAYTERRPDVWRRYFDYAPAGIWTQRYRVRLNNAGRFQLPPTRVDALYAPAVSGAVPNETLTVLP